MEKIRRYALPILLLVCVIFFGCPDKKAAEPEKGAIKQWTEETGKKAVDKLQAPIDKARVLKEQTDARMRDMKSKLGEQMKELEEKAPAGK
ncbi:MAG: hypothetical protein V3S89_15265 [Desulfobacterales bacterium]